MQEKIEQGRCNKGIKRRGGTSDQSRKCPKMWYGRCNEQGTPHKQSAKQDSFPTTFYNIKYIRNIYNLAKF